MLSKLTLSKKTREGIYYAAPKIATISLYAPINIVQGIYAKYYGLTLATIASVILFARLFDAITDPIVGILSDKMKSKWGTRKPFMVLGGFVLSISGLFLYSPPANVNAFYFSFWFVIFYLGFTLFEIPHAAWGGEISPDTHEKTRIYNLRTICGTAGLLLFYSIPLLPLWESTEITPETLRVSAIVSGVLMLPLLYFSMSRVSVGGYHSSEKPRSIASKAMIDKSYLNFVFANRPLLIFLCTFVFAGIGLGMWYGLIFIFVDSYLGRGDLFSELYLVSLLIGIVSSLAWVKLSRYLGKKRTWMLAMVLSLFCFIYTYFLGQDNATYSLLLILFSLNAICMVCTDTLSQSMLSDIVDYSSLKFGVHRGSTYFSIYIFVFKVTFALGGALGLAVAGWYGFDPSASEHDSSGGFGLTVAMVWLPMLFMVFSIIFVGLSPITERRHLIIRRRLSVLETRRNICRNATDVTEAVQKATVLSQ